MTAPVRPSIDDIVQEVDKRPSIDDIVASVDGGAHRPLTKPQIRRLGQSQQEKNEADRVGVGDYISNALEAPATFAAGIPGVKLATSYLGSKLSGDTMANTQREINDRTSGNDLTDLPEGSGLRKLGQRASLVGQAAGTMALAPVLPASGAAAGAILGGAGQLLNNDPGSGIGGRLARGAVGAVGGAAVGKVADMAMGGARMLAAKGGEGAKKAVLGERAEITKPLYDAIENATPQPLTQEMTAMYQHDDIQPIVQGLQKLEQYKGKGLNDPTFIMAVRKNLSDWGHQLDKQGAVTDPSKANLIGDLKEHVRLLKDAFDTAADTQVPGFSNTVKTFADESVPVSGQEVGYDAMRRKMTGGLTAWKNIGKKTPDALGTFLDKNPQGADEATAGILAAGRDAFLNGKRVSALSNAPSLLQRADQAAGNVTPDLIQKALLALIAAKAPR